MSPGNDSNPKEFFMSTNQPPDPTLFSSFMYVCLLQIYPEPSQVSPGFGYNSIQWITVTVWLKVKGTYSSPKTSDRSPGLPHRRSHTMRLRKVPMQIVPKMITLSVLKDGRLRGMGELQETEASMVFLISFSQRYVNSTGKIKRIFFLKF